MRQALPRNVNQRYYKEIKLQTSSLHEHKQKHTQQNIIKVNLALCKNGTMS